jgi:hypothetical protein
MTATFSLPVQRASGMPVTNEYFNVYSTPPINESSEQQPHKVKEIDLGIRWNFTKNMGENATTFSGRHKNEIFYNPLTYANENYDKTKRGLLHHVHRKLKNLVYIKQRLMK